MESRKDALLGASTYVAEAHRMVRERFPDGIFHCKHLGASPGLFNMIPEQAEITWECRHTDRERLGEMVAQLIQLAEKLAQQVHVEVCTEQLVNTTAATMSGRVVLMMEKICQQLGLQAMRLTSYAGHDAQIMSAFTPSGLIFIPSVGGISHSPKEFTEWEHVVQGANVLLQTTLQLAQTAG